LIAAKDKRSLPFGFKAMMKTRRTIAHFRKKKTLSFANRIG
jgi:hypothetical protein